MSFGRVEADWDRPFYVIGGGPSLAGPYEGTLQVDPRRLRDRGYVIGVNRAADTFSCDATFSLDRKFAEEYADCLTDWVGSQEVYLAVPETWFVDGRKPIPGVTYLRRKAMQGLSEDPTVIANGLNSGYGALNLAVLKGARTIYLLGFDLVTPTHWHDGYPWSSGSSRIYFDRWAKRFVDAAGDCKRLGVRVLNANPRSAIRAFDFTTYEELP